MKIFIDGAYGTTGMQLQSRLAQIQDLEYITLRDEYKDMSARANALNSCDVAFLCLPDQAAIEAVSLIKNDNVIVIDSSTAHRTNPDWAYGFPELSEKFANKIKTSNRIAVPGCHASGFNAICYPLFCHSGARSEPGIPFNENIVCYSLTGYSGGGNAMIEEFEKLGDKAFGAYPYALQLKHKHLAEMISVCGLSRPPIFQPIITPVKQGMLVSVPLFEDCEKIYDILYSHYKNAENIDVTVPDNGDVLFMTEQNNTNKMRLIVYGNDNQTIVTAQLDNLGKGASGAALQCFKLRCGL